MVAAQRKFHAGHHAEEGVQLVQQGPVRAVRAPQPLVAQFAELLLSMDYGDAEVRPLLDLEGLKEWRPGRTTQYDALQRAVDALGFYDDRGAITADGYRP